ncbi:MAG: hypothetical protein CMI52_02365 [Parcubacteria group bacterium]|nr:hypothetical protein [Parcubacteria group bacterium]
MVVHSDMVYMRYPTDVLMFFHQDTVLSPRSDLFHKMLSLSYVALKDGEKCERKWAHEISVCVLGIDARFGANVARWFAQARVGALTLVGRERVSLGDDEQCLLIDNQIGELCTCVVARSITAHFPDTVCRTRSVSLFKHSLDEYDLVVCTSTDPKLHARLKKARTWKLVIP